MISPQPSVLDGQLRAAVAAAVEESSLRGVARDVGLSPTGLGKFLSGSRPYASTRRKLERWAASHGAARKGGLAQGQAVHLLRVLLQDLPPGAVPAAEDRMVAALEAVYSASRAGTPQWLRALRGALPR
jgi:hypothetical protein